METSNDTTSCETFEKYETPSIIVAMQDLVDYLEYFLEFITIVLEFPYLPEDALNVTLEFKNAASEVQQSYIQAIKTESLELLETKQDEILPDIASIFLILAKNEMLIDKYLEYLDDEPPLRYQFDDVGDIIMSESANC